MAFQGLTPASYAERAPIALTAPDGTALQLHALAADTVVDGPLGYTELRLSFHNPEARMIEGRFRMAVPSGASVSRFAMKIHGRWQEGEVVESRRATRVYEDFLHQKVDPALLEPGAGNELTARVYPILAASSVELVVGYSQEIVGEVDVLPLEGMPPIGELNARVFDAASGAREVVLASGEPDAAVQSIARRGDGLRHQELLVARLRPALDAPPEPLHDAVFLLDTSASRAFELASQVELLAGLVARLRARAPAARIVVGAFDQSPELVYAGPARDFAARHENALLRRRALGASDLGRALAWARVAAAGHRIARVVAITDGIPTAGATEPRTLASEARALTRAGVKRLDVVAVGALRDEALLATLVTAGLPRDGIVVDGALDLAIVWSKLGRATRSALAVEVVGARWWWPRRLDGVQPGDERLVFAELPDAAQPIVRVGGVVQPAPELRTTERPLLERAVARARIASLVEREHREGSTEASRRAIVELSTRHRVLGPYTSLLVLEQEWHYQRFGIDRRALTDILTVQHGRVEVMRRSAAAPPPSAAPPIATEPLAARGNMWGDPIGDSFGLGGLGERGGGEARHDLDAVIGPGASPPPAAPASGMGSGHGRLARSHRARPPSVRGGATSVSGRLPPEVIQRIVRQNFGRFRGAYEKALRRQPGIRGRIAVRFVIGNKGDVRQASIAESELSDGELHNDILAAFRSLRFPQPEGGIITVVYPLVFLPEGETSAQPAGLRPNAMRRPLPQPPPPGKPLPERPAVAVPHSGELAAVMRELRAGRVSEALDRAARWQAQAPGDALALVALGEALEAAGQPHWAARAYGSIVDLFPTRADLRRFAGGYLERAGQLDLALDSYEKALHQRADHPSGHRLYAYALVKKRRYAEAFALLGDAIRSRIFDNRFAAAREILREDMGLVAAAWLAAAPAERVRVLAELELSGARLADGPSLRVVLTWETDANDVDLHVWAAGEHAYYDRRTLSGGGTLLADVTDGYGPELFRVDRPVARRPSYRLQAHYYARGPMGYGMGKAAIVDHDGHGKLRFEERPFVVMLDRAYVDLGTVE